MEDKRYDLVVLGSGSTAFAAALRAAEMGKMKLREAIADVGIEANVVYVGALGQDGVQVFRSDVAGESWKAVN